MKNKTEDLLPKIAAQGGTVHRQFVRCGKASCKCARGELHGAYYYYFVRVGGRLRKCYLKSDEVQAVMAACRARRADETARRMETRQAHQSIRELVARLRHIQSELI